MFKHIALAAFALVVLGASASQVLAQGYGPGRMGYGPGYGMGRGCQTVCARTNTPVSCYGSGYAQPGQNGAQGPAVTPDGSVQKQSFIPGQGRGRQGRI